MGTDDCLQRFSMLLIALGRRDLTFDLGEAAFNPAELFRPHRPGFPRLRELASCYMELRFGDLQRCLGTPQRFTRCPFIGARAGNDNSIRLPSARQGHRLRSDRITLSQRAFMLRQRACVLTFRRPALTSGSVKSVICLGERLLGNFEIGG